MLKFSKMPLLLPLLAAVLCLAASGGLAAGKQKTQPRATNKNIEQDMDKAVALKTQVDENSNPQAQVAAHEKLQQIKDRVEKHLEAKPNDIAAQNSGARFYQKTGDLPKAAALVNHALSLARPGGSKLLTSEVLVTRGLIRYDAGDFPAANADAAQALRFNPKNWAAFELYKYTVSRPPRQAASTALAGDNSGSAQTPEELREELARKHERSERLFAMQTPGRENSMEEWLARVQVNPTTADEAVLKSGQSRKKGDLVGALAYAEAAVRAGSGETIAYAQRGLIRKENKDYNGAIIDLTVAVTRGWRSDSLYLLRAESLLMMGRYRAALEDAEMAVATDPKSALSYYLRATAKLKLGYSWDKVLADLEIAARLDPAKYAAFYLNLKRKNQGASSVVAKVPVPAR